MKALDGHAIGSDVQHDRRSMKLARPTRLSESRAPAIGQALSCRLFAAAVILVAIPLRAQTPAFGPEFQVVGGYTTAQLTVGGVAMDAAGNFVVTWDYMPVITGIARSPGTAALESVYAQRYDFAGTPQGPPFQVNPSDTQAADPHAGMDSSGNFVVVWYNPSAEVEDVFGQRYDNVGNPLGGMFLVNSYTTNTQLESAIGMNSSGEFVVAWRSYHQEGSYGYGYGVYAQRYDSAGNPQGGEFHVNTYTTNNQDFASVAINTAGNFVIAWDSDGQDYPGQPFSAGIFFQRFSSSGVPLGAETQANVYTSGDQTHSSVGMDAVGNFVVVWANNEAEDGSGPGVFGRRYDSNGNPQSGEFLVNTTTLGSQLGASISMIGSGDFVVVWNGQYEGYSYRVFCQRFDGVGRRVGSEFQVNSPTTISLEGGPVATNDSGNMIVAWNQGGNGATAPLIARRVELYAAHLMTVDVHGDGTTSNLNGVLEPGETVVVEPAWRDTLPVDVSFVGTASNINGPPGPSYSIGDASADYGTLASGDTTGCFEATGDCYAVTVSGTRPAQHWDVTFDEALSPGFMSLSKTWTLHVGESFPDVPTTNEFYAYIENLFHNGITGGCGDGDYCPDASVRRDQMAVFLLKAKHGSGFVPPPCAGIFGDVPCPSQFADWIEELSAEGITGGCGGGDFCPNNPATRAQMAVFLLKAEHGSTYAPPACAGIFGDVPCPSLFADWIEQLYAEGVTGGCQISPPLYCPGNSVTRGQMAVFLVKTFGLELYGP